jgi:hypothetical protein
MSNTTEKSANQLYRESGTNLSFKDWIEREKAKGINIPNIEANAAMFNAMAAEERTKTKEIEKDGNKTLVRNIAFAVAIIALGYVAFRTFRAQNNE